MTADSKRKRLGQHFLIDTQVIDDIVALISPKAGQTIVEIGPGLGALTQHLVRSDAILHAIEVDSNLVRKLQDEFAANSLTLHHSDVLQFDFSSLKPEHGKLRIVGNLPYSISTPLIFHLLKYADIIQDMVFMVQYEVAERLVADRGTSSYGRLTVCASNTFEIESVFEVEPGAFSPPPEVRSSVIVMRPNPVSAMDPESSRLFSELVRLAFGKRRKTLKNALAGTVDEATFRDAGIDARLRAENLTVDQYVQLTECVIFRSSNRQANLMTVHD